METVKNDEKDDSKCAEVSDESAIRTIFDAALDFLRLVGSDVFDNKVEKISNQQLPTCHLTTARTKPKPAVGRSSSVQRLEKKHVTKAQRRRLERIKAPVTIFRKPPMAAGLTENEQEKCVNQTLKYLGQMPKQEEFQPPPIPMVILNRADNVEESEEDVGSSREVVTDHEYLSSERDINLWKLLLSSPTNCNVFVGNLSHQVTGETLMAAFRTFCVSEEDTLKLKTHVVMDAAKRQSRGYGFVNFPLRRAAETAIICMQEFELYGRSTQLGWGQETSHESAGKGASKSNTAGIVVSDKVYTQDGCFTKRQAVKRKVSRWDQHVREKIPREDPEGCNKQSHDESMTLCGNKLSDNGTEKKECVEVERGIQQKETEKKECVEVERRNQHKETEKEECVEVERRNQLKETEKEECVEVEQRIQHKETEKDLVECRGTVDTAERESNTETKKLQARVKDTENRTIQCGFVEHAQGCSSSTGVDVPRAEENCEKCIVAATEDGGPSAGAKLTFEIDQRTKQRKLERGGSSQRSSVDALSVTEKKDGHETAFGSESSQIEENNEVCRLKRTRSQTPIKSSTSRKDVHWLTHSQRVSLLKSVCCRLREAGVTGHLGVFGTHYEADNSRLYVVCAKHLAEAELCHEFIQFGSMEVKLNLDVSGNSKGCAYVQYSNSKDAETAMKQLHGKVLGGCPLKVMVAEPKTRKGCQHKRTQKSSIS